MTKKRKTPAAGGQTGAGKTKRSAKSNATRKSSPSKQAVEFLTRAFAGRKEGFVHLDAFNPTGKGTGAISAPVSDLSSLAPFIDEWNGKWNLYWSVNLLRTQLNKKATKDDILEMNHMHADLDPTKDESPEVAQPRLKAALDAFQLPPNIIINSGAGFGAFWRVDNPPRIRSSDMDELEALNKRLALALGGDDCWNIDRVMRLPFTTNLPTATKLKKGRGTYEATLVHQDDGMYKTASIETLPIKSKGSKRAVLETDTSNLSERVARLAVKVPLLGKRLSGDTEGMNDTSRSALDFAVVALMIKAGCFPDEIKATLVTYSHGKIHEEKNPDVYLGRMLKKLDYTPQQSRAAFTPEFVSGADIQAMDLPDLQWVIEGMLPEGLAIIAGRPKQGKSRMAMNIVAAVAQEMGKALGSLDVAHGRVLVLALEDSERRLKRRLTEIGAWPEKLVFTTKWEPGNVAAFEEFLDAHPDTKVIIIDTYGRWVPPSEKGRNPYESSVANLAILQAIAMERHIAIVLVMHTRKSEAAEAIDEISGDTGLSGTADTIWVLKRVPGQTSDGILHVTGRDVELESYALDWDERLFSWKLVGKAKDVFMSRERMEVCDVLRRHPGGLSTTEIGDYLNGKSRQAMLKLLNPLMDEGHVKMIDRKYHGVAPDGTLYRKKERENSSSS